MSGTCFTQTTILTRGTLPPSRTGRTAVPPTGHPQRDRARTDRGRGDDRHVWAGVPHNVPVTPPLRPPASATPRCPPHRGGRRRRRRCRARHGRRPVPPGSTDRTATTRSGASPSPGHATASGTVTSPASAPVSATASACTGRGTPQPASATTPPSCCVDPYARGLDGRPALRAPRSYGHVVDGPRPGG